MPGAISYDLRLVEPDGDLKTFTGIPAAAGTFTKMTGVGIFSWQVRANFPTDTVTPTPGPYSLVGTFNHTMPEPLNPAEETGVARLLLSWDPRPRADEYRVQVSTRADFATTVEIDDDPDDRLRSAADVRRLHGRRHVLLARRHGRRRRNLGDFTGVRSFTLPAIPTPGSGGGDARPSRSSR